MKSQSTPVPWRRLIGVSAGGAESRWRALVRATVGCVFVLRCLYAMHVELLPEETYYWNYSQHLDYGYLDHPPLIAWLIRGATAVFGVTEFGVRFAALCCGALTGLFVYRLTRNVFGELAALLALGLSQALPFFFFAGVLMTPDALLTAAWAAALYCLERALIAGRARAWLGAGLAVGLGLISKYTMGLLGVATVMYMLADPRSHRWFRCWQPYAAVLIAGIAFAPVVVWNAEHHWASFAFQTARRLAETPRMSTHRLLAAVALLLTPVGLAAAAIALFGRGSAPPARRFLQFTVLLPLAVFALFSLRHEVKLDWAGCPCTGVLPLIAAGFAEGIAGGGAQRWLRLAWPPTLASLLLLYGAALFHLTLGIPGLGYTSHPELLPVGWRQLGSQVDALAADWRARHGDRPLIVGMDRYATASELAFYAADRTESVADTTSAHLFGNLGLMYEQWFPVERLAGRTLLLVSWDPHDLADARLKGRVGGLEPVHEAHLTRDGRPIHSYYYRFAIDYKYPCAEGVRYTPCSG